MTPCLTPLECEAVIGNIWFLIFAISVFAFAVGFCLGAVFGFELNERKRR